MQIKVLLAYFLINESSQSLKLALLSYSLHVIAMVVNLGNRCNLYNASELMLSRLWL